MSSGLLLLYYIVNCLLIHTCIKRHINHDYSFSAIVPIVQFDNFYQILSNLEIVKQTRSFVKY